MHKSIGVIAAAMVLLVSPCIAREEQDRKPEPAPVVTKYDKMQKKELQDELKKLQKDVLVAEQTAREAHDQARQAKDAYKSANEESRASGEIGRRECAAGSKRRSTG